MWTTEQSDAICAPVTNLLVSASAGSGKTAVMTERIIRRIMDEDGCDIDKILVMTFTNAAASEIRERINANIMKKINENPDDVRLKKQLALSANSHFSTIHSFCLDIIRSNFNTLGLDPQFRTGDPAEIELIKKEAIDNVFERFYESGDSNFLKLVSSYTRRTDSALIDIIIKIYDFSRSFPEPEKWLDEVVNQYRCGNVKVYQDVLLNKASYMVKKAFSIYKKAISLCDLDKEGVKLSEFLSDEMNICDEGIKSLSEWTKAYEYFSGIKFKTRSQSYVKNMDPDISEKAVSLRNEGKELLNGIKSIISLPEEELVEGMKNAASYIETIYSLVRDFSVEFSDLKFKKNLVDYSDYEHLSLKCLMDENGKKTDYARILSESFEEIYIDEYQDCNNVQERIFTLVSRMEEGQNNIFMVGDPKQSIYRFRDADPSLFTSKQKTYTRYDASDVSPCSLITLNKNFRSRCEILGAVNHIFSCVMTEDVGGLTYNEDEYLYYNENSPYTERDFFKTVDVDIINFEKENFPDDEEALTVDSAEAIYIAKKIRQIIDSKELVFDKEKGFREIKYSDIAVLMSSLKGHVQVYTDILKMYSIPVFTDYNEGYLYSEEISSLISVIKVVLNPLDDIELISALRLSIFDFDENEFMKIRLCDKNDYFINAMRLYESTYKDALGLKISNFLKLLEKLRTQSKLLSTVDFLNYLIDETNFNEYVMSLEIPGQALANVRLFIKRAEEFGNTDFKGIFNFIHFINENLRGKKDSPSASLIDESENVVRIMSIHKSKGLEFPVVILARCARQFNPFEERGDFLLHKKLGIGLKYSDITSHFSYPLISFTSIKEIINNERISEEERVLYVALTRAREKLIMVGCIPDAYKTLAKYDVYASYDKPFPQDILLGAKCFFDWIIPSVLYIEKDNPTYVGEYRTEDTAFKLSIIDSHTLDISDAYMDDASFDAKTMLNMGEEDDTSLTSSDIYKRFTYVYPGYTNDIPTAFTVTELKEFYNRLENDEDYSYYSIPPIRERKKDVKDSHARKGTITHLVLKHIDFCEDISVSYVKSFMEKMAEKNFFTEDDMKLVDAESVVEFLKSDLGRRILKSPSVYREFPFKVLKSAKEVSEHFEDSDETIVIQGTVDLFFENERGNYTLVDYKTDKTDDEDKIRANYKNQILLYKDAICEITGKDCDECYICLLNCNKIIKI